MIESLNIYKTLWITVDGSMNFQEAVEAGHYNQVDQHITPEDFTIVQSVRRVEAVLVQIRQTWFGPEKSISREQILTALDDAGLRAGELHELLALGAEYEYQNEYPSHIIAFGTVLKYKLCNETVPFLGQWVGPRALRQYWCGIRDYADSSLILAFRKEDTPE